MDRYPSTLILKEQNGKLEKLNPIFSKNFPNFAKG
jgi:hypothetical protein